MKWYFALNQESLDQRREMWESLITVAVKSALSAGGLEPHMVFDGSRDDFVDRLADEYGVNILRHRVSFHDSLLAYTGQRKNFARSAAGAFLRAEIPALEQDHDVVLYTDCDVLFRKTPGLVGRVPRYFACAPEMTETDYTSFNTGVMLMNIPALRGDLPQFVSFIRSNLHSFEVTFDQAAYQLFYGEAKADKLETRFNWKPYWGQSEDAEIIHFHGVKPHLAETMLADPNDSTNVTRNLRPLLERSVSGYQHYLGAWKQVLSN